MAGYLMGNLMSNNAASMRATPLVSTKAGKLSTADGSSTFARKSGPVSTSAKTFSAKPSTVKMAPMTKASVKSTGGFGATRTASPSIKSTGGVRSIGG